MSLNLVELKQYKWLVFATVSIGSIMIANHYASVIIALPTIAQSFSVDLTIVQWVILAETLTISALLLPMGRFSDLLGRKPLYLTGLVVYGLSSFIAGSASTISKFFNIDHEILTMLFFRVPQGIGGAMVQATGMAMVISVFPKNQRGRSLGAYGSVIGAGGVLGPIIGGLLISTIGWQWIFYINLPVCLFALGFSSIILSPQNDRNLSHESSSYDWFGAMASSATLVILLLTLSNGANYGWSSFPIITGGFVSALALTLFLLWERRFISPMLDLSLFLNKRFSVGVGSNYLSFLGVSSFRFIIPFFLQGALRLSPLQVAIMLLPNAISRIVLGPISGSLSDRFNARAIMTTGLALSGTGLYLLAFMDPNSSSLYVLSSIIVFSSGSGIFMSPNSASIFISSGENSAGVVSALLNLSRNTGNVTGIAIATTVIAAVMMSQGLSTDVGAILTSHPSSNILGLFVRGMKLTFVIMGTLQLLSCYLHFTTRA